MDPMSEFQADFWEIQPSISYPEWPDDPYNLMRTPPLPTFEEPIEEIGTQACLQRFYEGPRTCKCCTNWVEREPLAIPDEKKEMYDGVAIRIYQGKDHSEPTVGGIKTNKPQHIVIQSPIIREHIEPILTKAGMPGEGKGKITIFAPFKVLFFTYSRLTDLYKKFDQGSNESVHFKLLIDVMDELFHEDSARITDLHAKKLIDCGNLWTIFPKGILLYSKTHGEDALYEYIDIKLCPDTKRLLIKCRLVGFNGTAFGLKETTLVQPEFHGTRPITELVAYPLTFHPNAKDIEERLLQRGKNILEYQNMVYKEYSGDARACPDEIDEDHDDEKRRRSGNVSALPFLTIVCSRTKKGRPGY
jgi:hypothetical protein